LLLSDPAFFYPVALTFQDSPTPKYGVLPRQFLKTRFWGKP